METLHILYDWCSYLNTKPKEVYYNTLNILNVLQQRYDSIQLIGRGYSGAQLVCALQTMNVQRRQQGLSRLKISGLIFRKEGKGSSTSISFTGSPIVVIDDDIYTGRTIKAIAHQLDYNCRNVSDVEVLIAMANPGALKAEEIIKETFPSLKLWIK